MIPKVGSIGKGLQKLARRKSFKAAEPHDGDRVGLMKRMLSDDDYYNNNIGNGNDNFPPMEVKMNLRRSSTNNATATGGVGGMHVGGHGNNKAFGNSGTTGTSGSMEDDLSLGSSSQQSGTTSFEFDYDNVDPWDVCPQAAPIVVPPHCGFSNNVPPMLGLNSVPPPPPPQQQQQQSQHSFMDDSVPPPPPPPQLREVPPPPPPPQQQTHQQSQLPPSMTPQVLPDYQADNIPTDSSTSAQAPPNLNNLPPNLNLTGAVSGGINGGVVNGGVNDGTTPPQPAMDFRVKELAEKIKKIAVKNEKHRDRESRESRDRDHINSTIYVATTEATSSSSSSMMNSGGDRTMNSSGNNMNNSSANNSNTTSGTINEGKRRSTDYRRSSMEHFKSSFRSVASNDETQYTQFSESTVLRSNLASSISNSHFNHSGPTTGTAATNISRTNPPPPPKRPSERQERGHSKSLNDSTNMMNEFFNSSVSSFNSSSGIGSRRYKGKKVPPPPPPPPKKQSSTRSFNATGDPADVNNNMHNSNSSKMSVQEDFNVSMPCLSGSDNNGGGSGRFSSGRGGNNNNVSNNRSRSNSNSFNASFSNIHDSFGGGDFQDFQEDARDNGRGGNNHGNGSGSNVGSSSRRFRRRKTVDHDLSASMPNVHQFQFHPAQGKFANFDGVTTNGISTHARGTFIERSTSVERSTSHVSSSTATSSSKGLSRSFHDDGDFMKMKHHRAVRPTKASSFYLESTDSTSSSSNNINNNANNKEQHRSSMMMPNVSEHESMTFHPAQGRSGTVGGNGGSNIGSSSKRTSMLLDSSERSMPNLHVNTTNASTSMSFHPAQGRSASFREESSGGGDHQGGGGAMIRPRTISENYEIKDIKSSGTSSANGNISGNTRSRSFSIDGGERFGASDRSQSIKLGSATAPAHDVSLEGPSRDPPANNGSILIPRRSGSPPPRRNNGSPMPRRSNSPMPRRPIVTKAPSRVSMMDNTAATNTKTRLHSSDTDVTATTEPDTSSTSSDEAKNKNSTRNTNINTSNGNNSNNTGDQQQKGSLFEKITSKFQGKDVNKGDNGISLNNKSARFDKNTGRCVNHPSIILARKKPFAKGWDMIREGCPHCMDKKARDQQEPPPPRGSKGIDELLAPSRQMTYDWNKSVENNSERIPGVDEFMASSKNQDGKTSGRDNRRVAPDTNKGSGGDRKVKHAHDLFEAAGALFEYDSAGVPVSDATGPSRAPPVSNNPTRRPASESRRSSNEGRRHATQSSSGPASSFDPIGHSMVSKMPYKTPWGIDGWYTGAVNKEGKPHGNGKMRYKNGTQDEGLWLNGYSDNYLKTNGPSKKKAQSPSSGDSGIPPLHYPPPNQGYPVMGGYHAQMPAPMAYPAPAPQYGYGYHPMQFYPSS